MRKVHDPQTHAEWQEAVDLASALLHLDSARAYGLVTGGPAVNVERCAQIVAEGQRLGVPPALDHVERFVQSLPGSHVFSASCLSGANSANAPVAVNDGEA